MCFGMICNDNAILVSESPRGIVRSSRRRLIGVIVL
jgi:hypothetical protein